MPLVGGELAHAAFDHGFESYGVNILRQYFQMASEKGESYLWYFPDGRPASVETSTSPEASPTDGWGSSAMLWALVEGLAGVVDLGCGFDSIRLSPRWIAADVDIAAVSVGYASSGRGMQYQFQCAPGSIDLQVTATKADLHCHVLLPPGAEPLSVIQDGAAIEFHLMHVEQSRYVDFHAQVEAESRFKIRLR
jgi:hypothetical protein